MIKTNKYRFGRGAATMAALLAVSACAASPGSIQPTPMPDGMYSSRDCQQAMSDHAAMTADLEALENAQRSAQAADAIGVFFVLLPVGSLTGGDKAGEIATTKGKLLALDARIANCAVAS